MPFRHYYLKGGACNIFEIILKEVILTEAALSDPNTVQL